MLRVGDKYEVYIFASMEFKVINSWWLWSFPNSSMATSAPYGG